MPRARADVNLQFFKQNATSTTTTTLPIAALSLSVAYTAVDIL